MKFAHPLLDPNDPLAGVKIEQPSPGDSGPARRAGSITLRERTGQGGDTSPMDPANQSLADALRIMLRLLQTGMFLLAVLYVFSGLKSVNETEQGIRLLFGKRQGPALDPGFHMTAPFPLGELVRVPRGFRDVAIDRDFWVYAPEDSAGVTLDRITPTESLKPDQGGSGSVLTADGNIAHTKWQVSYRREDVVKYAQNVLPEHEERLVRTAVKRGVVQACANVTIDELLKQSSDQTATIASRARGIAQATLDAFDSGLVIDQLTLDQKTPPLWIRRDFDRVQTASSNAAKAVEEANSERGKILNEVAGEAAEILLTLIDAHEEAVARENDALAAQTLARIDALLQGEPVEIDGNPVTARVSGAVTVTLSEAMRYRSGVINQAKSSLARFEAKEANYRANPSLMVTQEWRDAVSTFMNRDSVQVVYVPAGLAGMRMQINSDPDILREIDRAVKLRESQEAERRRMDELNRNRFRTDTTSIRAEG